MTMPNGQTQRGLADRTRRSRTRTEPPSAGRPFPARPTFATLPVAIAPEDLGITARSVAVTQSATERILPMLVGLYGDAEYKARREDGAGNRYRVFLEWLLKQRNAGQAEAEARLFEADLCAFLNDLYAHGSRPLPDVEALEARYEGECNAMAFDVRRRLASGEVETPEMYEALARSIAMHISHGIELFRLWQRRAVELRRSVRTLAVAEPRPSAPALRVER